MLGAHVCMSGMLECSGVDPCEACASAILTYVLVPAMKAANIDQRNDPRVARFLQTYAEARRSLVAGLLAQQPPPSPPPMVAPPTIPPIADLPLTEGELEAMASPVSPEVVVDMTGGPEPTPPGLLSDEEFRERFPTVVPEEVMGGVTEVPQPSILKLASEALTPKIPASEPASDAEVGIAPTEVPSPTETPETLPESVSAAPESLTTAETTDTDTVTTTSVKQADTNTTEANAHG